MAPEVLLVKEYLNVEYNPFPVDIWALGVLLWCIVNRRYPFAVEENAPISDLLTQQLEHKIRFSRKMAFEVTANLEDMFYRMLDPNVEKRIKMEQLVIHPWIAKEVRTVEDGIRAMAPTTPTSTQPTTNTTNKVTTPLDKNHKDTSHQAYIKKDHTGPSYKK